MPLFPCRGALTFWVMYFIYVTIEGWVLGWCTKLQFHGRYTSCTRSGHIFIILVNANSRECEMSFNSWNEIQVVDIWKENKSATQSSHYVLQWSKSTIVGDHFCKYNRWQSEVYTALIIDVGSTNDISCTCGCEMRSHWVSEQKENSSCNSNSAEHCSKVTLERPMQPMHLSRLWWDVLSGWTSQSSTHHGPSLCQANIHAYGARRGWHQWCHTLLCMYDFLYLLTCKTIVCPNRVFNEDEFIFGKTPNFERHLWFWAVACCIPNCVQTQLLSSMHKYCLKTVFTHTCNCTPKG